MSVIAEQFAERDAKLRDRAVHIFKIPESLAQHGVSEIGLVEMTMAEELLATRRSRGDAGRLAYEYAKKLMERHAIPFSYVPMVDDYASTKVATTGTRTITTTTTAPPQAI